MKTKSNSLVLTAALALAAAAAYGQDHRIVANVPFEFKTVAGVQPAGQYTVSEQGVSIRLRHVDGKVSLPGIGIERM